MTIATFGQKKEGVEYSNRYGVYAVIPNPENDKIILVQAPNGAWFLPGGEIEEGEDHLSALERELIEELGFTAKVGKYYGQADEYFYSRHRDRYFYNPAYIYETTSFERCGKWSIKQNNSDNFFMSNFVGYFTIHLISVIINSRSSYRRRSYEAYQYN